MKNDKESFFLERIEKDIQSLIALKAEQAAFDPVLDVAKLIDIELSALKQQKINAEDIADQAGVNVKTVGKMRSDVEKSSFANVKAVLDTLGYDLCAVKR